MQLTLPQEAAGRWVGELSGDVRELDPRQVFQRFYELAAACPPLIVLDNVSGQTPVEPLLVKAGGVATLLTTRFRKAVPAGVKVENLDPLPSNEAIALLRTHVGLIADTDPATGEVLEFCERSPLFINVAGAAVAQGYYSLGEYAKELRQRGLAALADEDERAARVFDLSWTHLSAEAKEVFGVLALAPGDDIGANLVRSWLRSSEGQHQAGKLLVELANASLLTSRPDLPNRYRFHDRVRDYALTKLPFPKEDVQGRLLTCWTDWDMVRGEFEAFGSYGLAGQYLRLRAWDLEEPTEFPAWFHFSLEQAWVLGLAPDMFFQQAYNEPTDSPVSRAALVRLGTAEEPERWLEWVNRPQEWSPPACLMVLAGHQGTVTSVAVTADGRIAVSGSSDRTVRVWDLADGRCTAVLKGHTNFVNTVAITADGRTAVSGAMDQTVRVWDLVGGFCTAVLEGHTEAVFTVAVAADGRTAVSGSFDRTIRVWDLAKCRCTAVLECHPGPITSLAMTADGRTAVSGSSDDGMVRVWDLVGGRCLPCSKAT